MLRIMAKKKNNNDSEHRGSADRHKEHKSVRIPMALYKKLTEIAQRNRRPITWQVQIALEEFAAANPPPTEQE